LIKLKIKTIIIRMDHIIIDYKNISYIIEKKSQESYDQFYKRAWLIAKNEPKNKKEFENSKLDAQKNINIEYLGYEY
tara:strand:+ start:351 stop:581 length:231 start_codon:yes stop_codon:yes gene_type:complete